MRGLEYQLIYDNSLEKIKEELDNSIKEINNYLMTQEDLTPSFINMMNGEIFDLSNNLNIILNFKKMNVDMIEIKYLERLIDISKKLNLKINFYVTKGEFNDPNLTESVDLIFKDETLDKLEEIDNYLISKNLDGLIFIESDFLEEIKWSIKDIKNANRRINSVVNHIKKEEFSPFEAVCFIHKMITSNFLYKENEEKPTLARSVIGVLNSDNIVCVGYSLLVKAIIDKLENVDIKSDIIVIQLHSESENMVSEYLNAGTGHMQNLIFINDEKYNIHGVYIVDTTFDSKNANFPRGKGIANFMLPVMDILNYNHTTIRQYDNNLDEMLGMVGIKSYCPEIPPVIEKYQNQSNVIELEKLINCMRIVYRYFFSITSSERLDAVIEKTLDISMIFSLNIFRADALNSIRVEAEKYEFEY